MQPTPPSFATTILLFSVMNKCQWGNRMCVRRTEWRLYGVNEYEVSMRCMCVLNEYELSMKWTWGEWTLPFKERFQRAPQPYSCTIGLFLCTFMPFITHLIPSSCAIRTWLWSAMKSVINSLFLASNYEPFLQARFLRAPHPLLTTPADCVCLLIASTMHFNPPSSAICAIFLSTQNESSFHMTELWIPLL